MAFTSWITNQSPANGGSVWYYTQQMLIGAGWSVYGIGAGTSSGVFTNTGGPLGSGLTIGQFNTAGAWCRLRAPDGSELIMQRGTTQTYNARLVYSPTLGFVTGGDEDTVPTAADQRTFLNDTQIMETNFSTTPHYMQGGADSSGGYGFWITLYRVGYTTPASSAVTSVFIDPVVQTHPADVLPGRQKMLGVDYNGSAWLRSRLAAGVTQTWLSADSTSASVPVPACYFRDFDYIVLPQNGTATLGANFMSGLEERFPLVYMRGNGNTPPTGYKGISSFITWETVQRPIGATKSGLTRFSMGDVTLPWDGVTVPLT